MLRHIVLVLLALVLASCGASTAPVSVAPAPSASIGAPSLAAVRGATPTAHPTPLPGPPAASAPVVAQVRLFDYNEDAPVVMQEGTRVDPVPLGINALPGVEVHSIQFTHPVTGTIDAYLVTPSSPGPFAGIVFLHGYPETQTEFLAEAVALAPSGVVSLLVAGRLPWQDIWTQTDQDQAAVTAQVIALRRAIDVVQARQDVDPQRIAFVGRDYGGMYGSILAGVDKRLKACVIMAAPPHFSDWIQYFTLLDTKQLRAYQHVMAPVDPVTYIGRAAPTALLLQYARADQYIPDAAAQRMHQAASEPKEIQVYDAGHQLNATAENDRRAWLKVQLGLTP